MPVDHSEKIAHLEAALASGIKSTTVDGETVTYASRREMLAEIQRLKREDTVNGYTKRQRIRSIRLGGF